MLALSPSLVSTTVWYLENNHTNYDQNFNHVGDSETVESVLHFSTSQQAQVELDRITPPITSYGDPKMHKKLNHNASERDRRKKVNDLYSSLRSLLPGTDRTKKLSIPKTVSSVVKYIPELQKEVKGLIHKKEELLSRISRLEDETLEEEKPKIIAQSTSISIWASRIDSRQIVVQISIDGKVHKTPLSEILCNLEEDGLILLNASSFESFGGRIFCNLHLQVERTHGLECEILSEKLMSLYDKREELLL
ncbi:transcription factor ORG2-like isoform X1 [Quercus robur]|uniref:BHLH domain-containing protein n=1 Tax=Quercus lobata TaxID=97700 RepID=A0A7N2M3A4_QUELO|nr:transcription factor ORG2-like [Quercus lobata]XP_050245350.1 transcription factor ORG2-like isoform X1 [Quercus robur]